MKKLFKTLTLFILVITLMTFAVTAYADEGNVELNTNEESSECTNGCTHEGPCTYDEEGNMTCCSSSTSNVSSSSGCCGSEGTSYSENISTYSLPFSIQIPEGNDSIETEIVRSTYSIPTVVEDEYGILTISSDSCSCQEGNGCSWQSPKMVSAGSNGCCKMYNRECSCGCGMQMKWMTVCGNANCPSRGGSWCCSDCDIICQGGCQGDEDYCSYSTCGQSGDCSCGCGVPPCPHSWKVTSTVDYDDEYHCSYLECELCGDITTDTNLHDTAGGIVGYDSAWKGHWAKYKCSVCGHITVQEHYSDHEYEDGPIVYRDETWHGYDEVCRICGWTNSYNTSNHDWQYTGYTPQDATYHLHNKYCPTCGGTGADLEAHVWQYTGKASYGDGTYHYNVYTCTVCGQTKNEIEAHVWQYTGKASYGDGTYHYNVYTCTFCGQTKNEIEAHTWVNDGAAIQDGAGGHLIEICANLCDYLYFEIFRSRYINQIISQ